LLIFEIVQHINKELPLHSMWDGFWVQSFKRGTLIISCSFDRSYYRNFDIVFKKVIFFNVPDEWRDTDIEGDDLLRLASAEEFQNHHPGFDPLDRHIIAVDIHFRDENGERIKHTFFILAEHIYLNKCVGPDSKPVVEYKDPFSNELFPCKKNRVS
jgi:hypothetical protein